MRGDFVVNKSTTQLPHVHGAAPPPSWLKASNASSTNFKSSRNLFFFISYPEVRRTETEQVSHLYVWKASFITDKAKRVILS